MLARPVRVGVLVGATRGQLRVLDSRFVVRFRDGIPPKKVSRYLAAADQRLREFIQAPGAMLIEFTESTYLTHLTTIGNWTRDRLLDFGKLT